MENQIKKLLEDHLHPLKLEVIDQSHHHSDHNPQAAKGGTHFAVVIVSQQFQGKSRVARHRMIYEILKGPLANGVHALALTTLTPEEMQKPD